MKKLFAVSISLVLLFTVTIDVLARGGGGCFEEGTRVLTPLGEVAIERLHVGDQVIGGIVQAVIRVEPDSYLELTVGRRIVHVTDEHPFQVAPGVFREASRLENVRRISAKRPAYNLLVSPGGTYIANGCVVHNKGCFLADTPILRADGSEVWIRNIKAGDELLAFTSSGDVVRTTVRSVLTHDVEEYLVVTLEKCDLRVTPEHPFYVGNGTFKTLEALQVGDSVFAYDGRGLAAQRIVSIERVGSRVRVYNLQTDAPNTFFANHIAVHNKGGGCFAAGTSIRTPDGEMAVEKIRPGDSVVADNGAPTSVQATFVTRAPLLTLRTDKGTLRTTAEHPLLCADGRFRDAGMLARGDRLPGATIIGVETGSEELVYNLRVGAPHTFVAGGFVVHNKGGGCFPEGVRISTPDGTRAIESLAIGDEVLAVDSKGRPVAAKVRCIYETTSPIVTIQLANGTRLRTTEEHPLALANGEFRLAEGVQVADRLRIWKHDHVSSSEIVERHVGDRLERVFNLDVGEPHTFIADGVVVHNKGGFHGGGFHGGSHHGGSNGPGDSFEPAAFLIVIGIGAGIYVLAKAAKSKEDEDLDFVYSRSAIEKKAAKTCKLLDFIAKTDPSFAVATLQKHATDTFLKLQECWTARDYVPMRPLLMPDLFASHLQQLGGLRRNREINVIDEIQVDSVDIVNVRYTYKENQREFTALITARAKDYYINEQTRAFLRGDRRPAQFQEFWTFQWQDGSWLLREIEQSRESDALQDENFFEQFTDTGRDQIYDETAGKEGPAGPWLEKNVATKATRIERMLNFLVQTDKIWNRQLMIQRARDVFTKVVLARESGKAADTPVADLSPEIAESLRVEIENRQRQGIRLEFRNLCVRKVELILVQNYVDNTKDQYIARISAHAQKIVKQNGQTVSAEEYVSPFEVYCVFGRIDKEWKLKEILPPSRGKSFLAQENLDEDSTPEQVQWYYTHTRAN
jgi:predicted lipid-binding transport protein (Tim44 family)